VVSNFEAGLTADVVKQGLEIIPFKQDSALTTFAEQDVLMSLAGPQKGLATSFLVDALNQVEFL